MLEKSGTKNLEQNQNALQKPTTEGVICLKKHLWTKYLNHLYLLWTNFPCKIFAEFRAKTHTLVFGFNGIGPSSGLLQHDRLIWIRTLVFMLLSFTRP